MKNKMNFVEKILIFLVLLKYVKNNDSGSCLDWTDWKEFKTDFHIDFYDSGLESIA
jgi:hypothetical protein